MVTKLDLLKNMARKHAADFELVARVFEIERGHLNLGEAEEKIRLDEVIEALSKWADNDSGGK